MDSDDDDDTESVVHQNHSLSTNSKPKLPLFKETENCDAWVDKCIFLIEMGGIDNAAKKVQHLCSNLSAPIQETVITELVIPAFLLYLSVLLTREHRHRLLLMNVSHHK